MSSHHENPPSSITSPEDPAARTAARSGAQATTEKSSAKATRPWFRRKRLTLPLALIAVILAVLAVLAVNGRSNTGTVASPTKAAVVTPDIGTKVRDGTFEFVVTGVERPGKSFMGKAGEKLTAQGEFVIVRVDVTNVGSKEKRLSCACQYLFNDKGTKFAPSPSILRTKDALKYVEWINPGATVKDVSVLFDISPGTKLDEIELHELPYSQGVSVKLS
ncbi:MAG: DUF4352 domain-containing protein [Actinomycetota bacterium]